MKIKEDFVKKLNRAVTIFFSIFAVSIGIYFFISFTSEINAMRESVEFLRNIVEEEGLINPILASLSSLNFIFVLQIIIFLVSIFALLASIKYTTDKYMIERKNALVDSLTELYNKKAILHFLKQELSRSARYNHPTSVAILDIDFFKKYNDTHGHVAGDKLLKRFGSILKDSVREFDEVGRFGGEEFMVVFPETKINQAVEVCERIREKIENARFYGQKKMPFGKITVSVGIAEVKGKRKVKEKRILEKADQLLYEAKESGRNRVIYKK